MIEIKPKIKQIYYIIYVLLCVFYFQTIQLKFSRHNYCVYQNIAH